MKFHVKNLRQNQFERLMKGENSVDGLVKGKEPLLLIYKDSQIRQGDLIGFNEMDSSSKDYYKECNLLTGRVILGYVEEIENASQWATINLSALRIHLIRTIELKDSDEFDPDIEENEDEEDDEI